MAVEASPAPRERPTPEPCADGASINAMPGASRVRVPVRDVSTGAIHAGRVRAHGDLVWFDSGFPRFKAGAAGIVESGVQYLCNEAGEFDKEPKPAWHTRANPDFEQRYTKKGLLAQTHGQGFWQDGLAQALLLVVMCRGSS